MYILLYFVLKNQKKIINIKNLTYSYDSRFLNS